MTQKKPKQPIVQKLHEKEGFLLLLLDMTHNSLLED